MKANLSGGLYSKVLFCSATCFLSAVFLTKVRAQSTPWVAPAQASTMKSPLTISSEALKEAKSIYTASCAPCHGDKGKGDGPAAAALNPKPADHTSGTLLQETDGAIFYKISEGRNPMPQFKTTLTENQRWTLVAYIRTLGKQAKK
jgi:mono/diheme cytochrome c family protein